jgi:hypothetical protein
MASRTFFGTVRIAILLAILAFVAVGAWLDRARSRDWNDTLRVTVYPVTQSADPDVRAYVRSLTAADFSATEEFFAVEAGDYGIALEQPIRIRVSLAASGVPPALPQRPHLLSIAWWSLKVRYFAARTAWRDPLPTPDIQVFAQYSPATPGVASVPDSVGLSKGLVAVTYLYADREAAATNQVVLAHELLHTLGATDKYDLRTGQPRVPDGLGDPAQRPMYPQQFGEIMAGRIATGATTAVIGESLDDMLVGPLTATEIGWDR